MEILLAHRRCDRAEVRIGGGAFGKIVMEYGGAAEDGKIEACVDDIAFLHSMYAESPIHGSAMLMMNSGRILSGHPAPGAG